MRQLLAAELARVRAAAHLAEEGIAQDRHDPGLEIGAHAELVGMRERAHHRLLHEVIGQGTIAREAERKGPKMREMPDDVAVQLLAHVFASLPLRAAGRLARGVLPEDADRRLLDGRLDVAAMRHHQHPYPTTIVPIVVCGTR